MVTTDYFITEKLACVIITSDPLGGQGEPSLHGIRSDCSYLQRVLGPSTRKPRSAFSAKDIVASPVCARENPGPLLRYRPACGPPCAARLLGHGCRRFSCSDRTGSSERSGSGVYCR